MKTSTAIAVVVITNGISTAVIVVPAALMGAPSWACWLAGTVGWLVMNASRYASAAVTTTAALSGGTRKWPV